VLEKLWIDNRISLGKEYRIKTGHDRRTYEYKTGTVIYDHLDGYFAVLEFKVKGGAYREAFAPNELIGI